MRFCALGPDRGLAACLSSCKLARDTGHGARGHAGGAAAFVRAPLGVRPPVDSALWARSSDGSMQQHTRRLPTRRQPERASTLIMSPRKTCSSRREFWRAWARRPLWRWRRGPALSARTRRSPPAGHFAAAAPRTAAFRLPAVRERDGRRRDGQARACGPRMLLTSMLAPAVTSAAHIDQAPAHPGAHVLHQNIIDGARCV
jgi:hypothetical protein